MNLVVGKSQFVLVGEFQLLTVTLHPHSNVNVNVLLGEIEIVPNSNPISPTSIDA